MRALLDHQQRDALVAQAAKDAIDGFHDQGAEAQSRFVEQHEPWPGHERAGDDELLLFAARELARGRGEAILQERELGHHVPEIFLDLLAIGAHLRAEPDVLLDRELGEDVAALGYQAQSLAGDVLGRYANN